MFRCEYISIYVCIYMDMYVYIYILETTCLLSRALHFFQDPAGIPRGSPWDPWTRSQNYDFELQHIGFEKALTLPFYVFIYIRIFL